MNAPIPHHRLLVALLIAVSSVGSAFGLSHLAAKGPALTPPPAIDHPASPERGRRLFVQSCAHCHGDDAHGSGEDADGPDLFGLRVGDARIAAVIHGGIPEEMPSFAKKHGPPDIADLTAYLRTLR
jgi:mono/diheme cytochrome c family protein